MGREGKLYSPRFYRELQAVRQSADEILPIVFGLVQPRSVVDIGCGNGQWLASALALEVEDVLGIDGAWVLDADLAIPQDRIQVHDLTAPLALARQFDLVLSLEVAEHLPAAAATTFVKSLCGAGNVILFSAAIPGQGGRHHVNEQWPAYWADLFRTEGFECYDVLRPEIWNNPRIAWYYAQNALLFARPGTLDRLGRTGAPLSLVHPTAWSAQVNQLNSPGKLLEKLFKALGRGARQQ